jgi:hypothetical protein
MLIVRELLVAGGNCHCRIRKLGVCEHQGRRFGVGRGHLALQPGDLFKFAVRYVLSGKAWNNLQNKTAFTTKKDFGREEREALWVTTQRSLSGLPAPPTWRPEP